jgi:hypothetical protein
VQALALREVIMILEQPAWRRLCVRVSYVVGGIVVHEN